MHETLQQQQNSPKNKRMHLYQSSCGKKSSFRKISVSRHNYHQPDALESIFQKKKNDFPKIVLPTLRESIERRTANLQQNEEKISVKEKKTTRKKKFAKLETKSNIHN